MLETTLNLEHRAISIWTFDRSDRENMDCIREQVDALLEGLA